MGVRPSFLEGGWVRYYPKEVFMSEVIHENFFNYSRLSNSHKLLNRCNHGGWRLDVLWGQPIKLIQVASNSELQENHRDSQKLTVSKIRYESF